MKICGESHRSQYFNVFRIKGEQTQVQLTVLAKAPMGSGYWCVKRANNAVKEQSPAVKTMKNGNSFLG